MKIYVRSALSREEQKRRSMFSDPALFPGIDPERLEDALEINWTDVDPDDCALLVRAESMLPSLNDVIAVRYFNDAEEQWARDNGFISGYVIDELVGESRGHTIALAWIRFGDEELVDVTSDLLDYADENPDLPIMEDAEIV